MDIIFPEVQEIFRTVLDQPDLVLTRESNASTVNNWDSLAHVDIITAAQLRFKVRFALSDLDHLKNVGDLVDLIRKKLEAK
jgi:acyl carrier protein